MRSRVLPTCCRRRSTWCGCRPPDRNSRPRCRPSFVIGAMPAPGRTGKPAAAAGLAAALLCGCWSGPTAAQGPPPVEVLPEIDVVAPAPLAAGGVPRDRIPAPTWTVDSEGLRAEGPPNLTQSLDRLVPGVALNDVTESPFQPDLQFRGFAASPVLGTPAGIAVYQNGARINEAFGDSVNWDLMPGFAVRRADLLTADPV